MNFIRSLPKRKYTEKSSNFDLFEGISILMSSSLVHQITTDENSLRYNGFQSCFAETILYRMKQSVRIDLLYWISKSTDPTK